MCKAFYEYSKFTDFIKYSETYFAIYASYNGKIDI